MLNIAYWMLNCMKEVHVVHMVGIQMCCIIPVDFKETTHETGEMNQREMLKTGTL